MTGFDAVAAARAAMATSVAATRAEARAKGYRVCPRCKGSGQVSWNPSRGQEPWFVETISCPHCGGDGVLQLCRRCGGKGAAPAGEDTCDRCLGDGIEP